MTPQQAKILLESPIFRAFAEDKTIERDIGSLSQPSVWAEVKAISVNDILYTPNFFRIKPEPKYRPWTYTEVPLGAWIRYKGESDRAIITHVSKTHIHIAGTDDTWDFNDALRYWDHSLDHGKTWLPCGILE